MVEYKCTRCNKIFNRKSSYDRHLSRKYPCKINIPHNTEPKSDCTKKKHECKYCNKEYTRLSSLHRHLKGRCDAMKEVENEINQKYKDLIKKLKKKNKKLKKEITKLKVDTVTKMNSQTINIDKQQNNINNISNVKNINNGVAIMINTHGKENFGHLTENIIKQLLLKGFKSVENLIKLVHFDENVPENHNIYISNMKDTYLIKYDGDDWNLEHKNRAIDDMYEQKSNYLIEKFEEYSDELDKKTIKTFGRFLKRSDDNEVMAKIKKEIKLILYNNRNLPLKTRKLLNIQEKVCE